MEVNQVKNIKMVAVSETAAGTPQDGIHSFSVAALTDDNYIYVMVDPNVSGSEWKKLPQIFHDKVDDVIPF
jgi:hypothetical protein